MEKTILISLDGYDLCIQCKEETKYKTNTPISNRIDYIEGAGQLCNSCGQELDKIRKDEIVKIA